MRPSEWARKADGGLGDASELITRVALILEGPVKKNTRVRTGTLRNSWHHRVSPNRGSVATNIFYAPFVDARYPILEPAVREALPRVEEEVRRFGLDGVRRMAR